MTALLGLASVYSARALPPTTGGHRRLQLDDLGAANDKVLSIRKTYNNGIDAMSSSLHIVVIGSGYSELRPLSPTYGKHLSA
jgi:hypothetical protein